MLVISSSPLVIELNIYIFVVSFLFLMATNYYNGFTKRGIPWQCEAKLTLI